MKKWHERLIFTVTLYTTADQFILELPSRLLLHEREVLDAARRSGIDDLKKLAKAIAMAGRVREDQVRITKASAVDFFQYTKRLPEWKRKEDAHPIRRSHA